jgi:hypothetical protein
LAKACTASMFSGLPNRCTGEMALVLGVRRFSASFRSIRKVSGSTSQITGFTPHTAAMLAVAMKVKAGTSTSSPGLKSAM